ncbi:MAG: hypothetical protein QM589_12980 [Thermomicrobiales bacterium]
MPVTVLSCERDPGNIEGPQAREPGSLERDYGCHPAANVGVTAFNRDLSYQERCDTDAKGRCVLTAPSGPKVDIELAVHTAMLPPGEAPREPIVSSRNYTEFRGATIVVLPDDEAATPSTRQTLTVNLTGCGGAACTDRDVLVQASPADISARDAAWFAPDDSGLVTIDIGQMPGAIDLMLSIDGKPDLTCVDDASGAAISAQWLDEREGTFSRIERTPGSSITCAVEMGPAG